MGMVLWGNLSWHPAVAAWQEAVPTAAAPETIEVLRSEDGKTSYRLVGVGSEGASVVARPSDAPGFAWTFCEERGAGRP